MCIEIHKVYSKCACIIESRQYGCFAAHFKDPQNPFDRHCTGKLTVKGGLVDELFKSVGGLGGEGVKGAAYSLCLRKDASKLYCEKHLVRHMEELLGIGGTT
jgi:hypothetical protein